MTKQIRLLYFALLIFTFAAAAKGSRAPADLLAQKERPSIEQIRDFSPEEADAFLGDATLTPQEVIAFTLYQVTMAELVKTPPNLPIFIFARDGEGLFDAIQSAGPDSLRRRVHLVNISRPVAATPDSNIVMKALRRMGMPIDEVANCESQIMWLDTGTRGTIYLNLFNHLFNTVGNSSHRPQTIRCLLENIDARLIVARSTESAGTFYNTILKTTDFSPSTLMSLMNSQFYFPELPSAGREKIGIPKGEHEKWQWITHNIEYLPKWDGRAVGLTPSGEPIITVEPREASRVNKEAYLRHQIKLFRHFSFLRVTDPVVTPPKAETKPTEKPTTDLEEEVVVSKWLAVEKIKALAKDIRHADDPAPYLAILSKITNDPKGAEFLLDHLPSSKQFAHIVYRHTDLFSKAFLKQYQHRIAELASEGAHERASEACRKFLGGK